jgi:hypothetical protein
MTTLKVIQSGIESRLKEKGLNMKTSLTLVFLCLMSSVARAQTPCPPEAKLGDDLFQKYQISIRFNQSFPLQPDSARTELRRDNAWRRYWGTAIHVAIDHAETLLFIPAGTVLEVNSKPTHWEGNASAAFSSVFSSEMNTFAFLPNSAMVRTIQVFSQPYSSVKVKRLERLLNATLFCQLDANHI